jgi:serine/threonine protein phosphatase 1
MVAVISDVHGCVHTLTELYNQTKDKYPKVKVYCVGDLVDRGNFSAETINFCIEKKIKCCLGNHDLMFLSYFRDSSSVMARSWVYNGHISTINSYKNQPMSLEPHLDYIEKLKLFYNTPDCFICHAGISIKYKKYFSDYKLDGLHDDFIHRTISRDLESDTSVIWARSNFLRLEKLQVVGHNRKFEVLFDKKNNMCFIDTGCAYGNKLTSLIVDNNVVVDKLEVPVIPTDLITR